MGGFRIDWSTVDWRKTNIQIALYHGLASQHYVASMRKKLGKPPSVIKPAKWNPYRGRPERIAA